MRGDWPIRLAFFLTGLSEEPAVARLIQEAEAAQRSDATTDVASSQGRSFSALIAVAFEATLVARLADARTLVVLVALFLGGGVDGALWLLGAGLERLGAS